MGDFLINLSHIFSKTVKQMYLKPNEMKRKYLRALMEDNKMSDGDYCNIDCIHFCENFETIDDEETEVSYCDLGNSEIYNRSFCEDYEE